MRFARRKHGGPTRTELAVKMYERVVLLLDVVGTGRVYEQEFHWVGIKALNCYALCSRLKRFVSTSTKLERTRKKGLGPCLVCPSDSKSHRLPWTFLGICVLGR